MPLHYNITPTHFPIEPEDLRLSYISRKVFGNEDKETQLDVFDRVPLLPSIFVSPFKNMDQLF